jgi:hypothetical protein
MASERVFEKMVDSEQVFVLQYRGSEQVFEEGDAMSVALELEYEAFYPRLEVVAAAQGRMRPSARVQRRRIVVGVVAAGLLVLLMLPIRALGGRSVAAAAPAAGHVYVVQNGDSLATIAARVDPSRSAALLHRLASEVGSTVVVPGEHLLIP